MFNCFDLNCPETNGLTMCHSVCAVLQLPHANQTKSNACLLLHTFFSFFSEKNVPLKEKAAAVNQLQYWCSAVLLFHNVSPCIHCWIWKTSISLTSSSWRLSWRKRWMTLKVRVWHPCLFAISSKTFLFLLLRNQPTSQNSQILIRDTEKQSLEALSCSLWCGWPWLNAHHS